HTRSTRDWSSDVCSSDLGRPDRVRTRWIAAGIGVLVAGAVLEFAAIRWTRLALLPLAVILAGLLLTVGARWMPRRTAKATGLVRSEERRVGKECRERWRG